MNNILDEITYSDGRMGDVAKALYTPAKLKLRARTYNGINENLSIRRGPVMKSATFNIPNAYMATEAPADGGNSSGFSVTSIEGLNNINLAAQQRKLKVSKNQIEKLAVSRGPVMESATFNTPNAIEEVAVQKEEIVTPAVAEETIVPEITPVEEATVTEKVTIQPEVQPVISNEQSTIDNVVVQNEQEAVSSIPTVEETTTNEVAIDPLDAAREKVLNTPNSISTTEQTNKDVVEKAEESDVFKTLEKVTTEYTAADKELKKSAQALENAQKDLENSKNNFEEIEKNIERANAKIQERNETIGSTKKEIEDIETQIKEIEEKTKAKIRLVNSAKEKKLREKLEKEKETSKVLGEKDSYQEKIEESTKKVSELEQQDRKLENEENEVINAKRKIQDEYNSKLAVFEAITLPEGISMEDEMEEVVSISKFPSFIDNEDNYSQEEDYTYSKKLAA